MIVGYRAVPPLVVILVTLLINLPEVLVYRLQCVTNLKFHRVTSEISFRFVQKTLKNIG